MKKLFITSILIIFAISLFTLPAIARNKINIVTTLPDYASMAQIIGGNLVNTKYITKGYQDAHFTRPKPTFIKWLKRCDLFVTTGMDLELWVPSLLRKAGNRKIMSGQIGYVSASYGVKKIEVPKSMTRSEGGLHIYGSPHITCSPINIIKSAKNIMVGLKKIDPSHGAVYEKNYKELKLKLCNRTFGKKLVKILGEDLLIKLADNNNLISFLKKQNYKGESLYDILGGWVGKVKNLRGMKIITYHRSWGYFCKLFGLKVAGEIEPKPGIPPSPKHVHELVKSMRAENVKVIWAANYYDVSKIRNIARKIHGKAFIVPMFVHGKPGIDDYFKLVDFWTDTLIKMSKVK